MILYVLPYIYIFLIYHIKAYVFPKNTWNMQIKIHYILTADWRGAGCTSERADRKSQTFIWAPRARTGDLWCGEFPIGFWKLGLIWLSQGRWQMIKPRLVGPFDADVSGYVVPVLSLTNGFTKNTFKVTMLYLSFKILIY